MEVPSTPHNDALAHAVNGRIAADARLITARSALVRLGGIGAMVGLASLGLGAGAGAAFFGYSYITDATTSTEKVATAMTTALERSTIRTTGEVKVTPDSVVKLDPNATVGVDPEGKVALLVPPDATVKLEPNAKITVNVPNTAVPRPSTEQWTGRNQPQTNAKVVTNFTIFKFVDYKNGTVATGWDFESSEQSVPKTEFCYYNQQAPGGEGVSFRVDLAVDGRLRPQTRSRGELNVIDAARHCIWFNGGQTDMNLNLSPNFNRGPGRVY
jgi:hypothetical protein